MSNGGKGSRPRPFSVTQHEYDTRWDMIFRRDEYQDILSTEDCIMSALNKIEEKENGAQSSSKG